jgi:hypothetical protein
MIALFPSCTKTFNSRHISGQKIALSDSGTSNISCSSLTLTSYSTNSYSSFMLLSKLSQWQLSPLLTCFETLWRSCFPIFLSCIYLGHGCSHTQNTTKKTNPNSLIETTQIGEREGRGRRAQDLAEVLSVLGFLCQGVPLDNHPLLLQRRPRPEVTARVDFQNAIILDWSLSTVLIDTHIYVLNAPRFWALF